MRKKLILFTLLAFVTGTEARDKTKLTPEQLEKTQKCSSARFENTFLGKRTSRSIGICRIELGDLVVSSHKTAVAEIDARLKTHGSSEAWTQGSSDAGSPSSRLCKQLGGDYRLGRLVHGKRAFETDLCFFKDHAFANSAYLMWRKGRI